MQRWDIRAARGAAVRHRRLKEKFGVAHATNEVEYGACADDAGKVAV